MLFLWILLAVVLLLVFILFVNVNLIIEHKEEFRFFVRVLFVKINLEQFKKKKSTDMTVEKKNKEPIPQTEEKSKKKNKKSVFEFLSFVADIIKSILKNFAKYAKIKLCYANISVASDDAAKTAMLYGIVCQGLYYVTELLTHFTKFKKNYKKIKVVSDFTSEEIKYDFKLVITLKPVHLLIIGIKLIPIFTNKQNKKSRKEVIPNE